MKRYVLGFCFGPLLDKVTLIRKTKPEWQKGRLNGVGGHIEDGETPTEAMMREFREEAAFDYTLLWTNFGKLSGDGWEVYLFYSVRQITPGPFNNCEEGLVTTHHIASVLSGESQGTPVMPNLKYLIPMALNHVLGADKAEYFEIRECKRAARETREAPPLTEARVRELIREAQTNMGFYPVQLSPPVEPKKPFGPINPPPSVEPLKPFGPINPPVVAYACGFPAVTALYMAVMPNGWAPTGGGNTSGSVYGAPIANEGGHPAPAEKEGPA